MTLLAALCIGTFAYLLTGVVVGRVPHLVPRARSSGLIARQRTWLVQAGVRASLGRFWLLCGALGSSAFVVAWSVTRAPLVALEIGRAHV